MTSEWKEAKVIGFLLSLCLTVAIVFGFVRAENIAMWFASKLGSEHYSDFLLLTKAIGWVLGAMSIVYTATLFLVAFVVNASDFEHTFMD